MPTTTDAADTVDAIREQARREVADWPPLTAEQRQQLATLLSPVTAGGLHDLHG